MAVGANAGTVRARITLENGEFRSRMADARRDMRQLGQEAKQLKISQSQMQGALMGIGTGIVAAIGASVVTAARFEQSMAKVKAISGATGTEFDALTEKAKELGATTAFSATQAADGMALLAAAGFKTNDIIGSMDGLLNLAGAAGLDLAKSADYLGSIMSGFGIKAQDSSHAVDVLVRSMNDANTDLPDLAEAMKYVAPVASSMKISMEDTAAAISLMSNYGIKGSQAGTTLRASLLALANPVGQGKKAMKELGLSIKDANGEMLSFPDMIDAIAKSMEGMTNADKVSTAAMLVGTEASSGFLALLNEGGDTIDNFAENLRNADGAAADMAATMKDTLIGQWDQFTSAIEGIGISIGEQFMPEVKALVEGATDILEVVSKINPEFVEMAFKMIGGASAAGTLFFALNKLPLLFRTLSIAMGPTGWIVLGLGAIAGAMLNVKDTSDQYSEMTMTQLNDAAKQNKSLQDQADRYDVLRAKMSLSNDEWARYIDLSTQLPSLKNEDEIAAAKKEMEGLAKHSGLTVKELDELVGLNRDIAEIVPDATATISDQNNVVMRSTDAVRKYTDAKRDELLIELQVKKAKAEANELENRARQKAINGEMKGLQKDILDLEKKISSEKSNQKYLVDQQNKAEKEGHTQQKVFYEEEAIKSRVKLQKLGEQKVEIYKRVQALEKEGRTIETELGLLDTVDQQMANIILSQVGLNGKKEDGVRIINDEILKTADLINNVDEKAKKEKLSKEQVKTLVSQYTKHIEQLEDAKGLLDKQIGVKNKDKKLTAEQKKVAKEYNEELKKHGLTIDTNTGKVSKLNKEAGKKVTKEVKTDDKGSNAKNHAEATKKGTKEVKANDKGSNSKNHSEATKKGTKSITAKIINLASFLANFNPKTMTVKVAADLIGSAWDKITGKKHSGGTLHELPKFHDGGSPNLTLSSFGRMGSAPKFDEVDVRLLRNEMVLTQGQQANLFRMISTFGAVAAAQVKGAVNGGSSPSSTVIQVASMVVREEADIKRVAEELDRLATQKQRSRGEY